MAMGGKLRCESQVGVGTTFSFTLDLARTSRPVAGTSTEASEHQDAPGGEEQGLRLSGRALVVEDNPVNQEVCGQMLRRLGCDVVRDPGGVRAGR